MAIMDETLGPLLIGFTISIFLFGVSTVQVYFYYHYFPQDRMSLKVLVISVWLTEFVYGILLTAGAYRELVTLFGSAEVLLILPAPIYVSLILGGFLASMCQGFFILRVWKYTQSKIIAALLVTLTVLRFIGTVAVGSLALYLGVPRPGAPSREVLSTFMHQYDWLITTNLVIGACNDVLITFFLTTKLATQRRTAFKRTAQLLDKLILWTIETGLLTSIVAVATAVCSITMKLNFIWIGFYVILPRVFANGLLAALNSRQFLYESRDVNPVISFGASRSPEVSGDTAGSIPRPVHKSIAIEMTTTVIESESNNFETKQTTGGRV